MDLLLSSSADQHFSSTGDENDVQQKTVDTAEQGDCMEEQQQGQAEDSVEREKESDQIEDSVENQNRESDDKQETVDDEGEEKGVSDSDQGQSNLTGDEQVDTTDNHNTHTADQCNGTTDKGDALKAMISKRIGPSRKLIAYKMLQHRFGEINGGDKYKLKLAYKKLKYEQSIVKEKLTEQGALTIGHAMEKVLLLREGTRIQKTVLELPHEDTLEQQLQVDGSDRCEEETSKEEVINEILIAEMDEQEHGYEENQNDNSGNGKIDDAEEEMVENTEERERVTCDEGEQEACSETLESPDTDTRDVTEHEGSKGPDGDQSNTIITGLTENTDETSGNQDNDDSGEHQSDINADFN